MLVSVRCKHSAQSHEAPQEGGNGQCSQKSSGQEVRKREPGSVWPGCCEKGPQTGWFKEENCVSS